MTWRTQSKEGEQVRKRVGKRQVQKGWEQGEAWSKSRKTSSTPGELALVSPVPIEEGLAQTLSASLMEPLQAAPALQHFQVPPEGEYSIVASRHHLPYNCPITTCYPYRASLTPP
jgi:hypothetical protein